jgi:hypothetical protein
MARAVHGLDSIHAVFRRNAEHLISKFIGYDLATILEHVVVRFVPLDSSNAKKIDAMETHLLMTLIARGQCKLNSAKRIPALSKAEFDFIANNQF